MGYHHDLRHMDRLRALLDIADAMLPQGAGRAADAGRQACAPDPALERTRVAQTVVAAALAREAIRRPFAIPRTQASPTRMAVAMG